MNRNSACKIVWRGGVPLFVPRAVQSVGLLKLGVDLRTVDAVMLETYATSRLGGNNAGEDVETADTLER